MSIKKKGREASVPVERRAFSTMYLLKVGNVLYPVKVNKHLYFLKVEKHLSLYICER